MKVLSALSRLWLAFLCGTFAGCGWQPDEAAVIRIRVGQKAVYLKRQVWGRNGSAIVLSPDPNWRHMPEADDYVWTAAEEPFLLFRSDGDGVYFWGNGTNTWRAPESGYFPVSVVFHEVDIPTQAELFEKPTEHGLHCLGGNGQWRWPLRKPPVDPVEL